MPPLEHPTTLQPFPRISSPVTDPEPKPPVASKRRPRTHSRRAAPLLDGHTHTARRGSSRGGGESQEARLRLELAPGPRQASMSTGKMDAASTLTAFLAARQAQASTHVGTLAREQAAAAAAQGTGNRPTHHSHHPHHPYLPAAGASGRRGKPTRVAVVRAAARAHDGHTMTGTAGVMAQTPALTVAPGAPSMVPIVLRSDVQLAAADGPADGGGAKSGRRSGSGPGSSRGSGAETLSSLQGRGGSGGGYTVHTLSMDGAALGPAEGRARGRGEQPRSRSRALSMSGELGLNQLPPHQARPALTVGDGS